MHSDRKFRFAVIWAYAMNLGQQGSAALLAFVLAALLGPSDFGTVAVAMVYILFIQMFLEQGFTAALIQRKNLDNRHLDSVFWMTLIMSLILSGVSIALSGSWAKTIQLSELPKVISALSIVLPIEGLTVVQRAVFQRKLDFRSLAIRANVSTLVGGVIGIGMALLGYGVWALVAQKICRELVALALLWGLSKWRPRFRFSVNAVRELLGFSTSNFIAKLGIFACNRSELPIIGIFFGSASAGLYRVAESLMNMLLTMITSSLQVVAFPQFSRLQDNIPKLKDNVLICIHVCSLVTIPAMVGLGAMSDPLMAIMGHEWAIAADVLKILCIIGVMRATNQFVGPLLQAVSKPHLLAILAWASAGVNVSTLVAVSFFVENASTWEQVMAVASARVMFELLVATPVSIFVLFRFCQISIKDLIEAIFPSFVAATAVGSVIFCIRASGLVKDANILLGILAEAVPATLAAVGFLYFMDNQLRNMVDSKISQLRSKSSVEIAEGIEKTTFS